MFSNHGHKFTNIMLKWEERKKKYDETVPDNRNLTD